jgi:hypothetical protein
MNPTGGVRFSLEYTGADADNHIIDMYDVSQALLSFQGGIKGVSFEIKGEIKRARLN